MFRNIIIFVLVGLLTGCSIANYKSYESMPEKYKTFVPVKFIELKSGMSIEEVREIMGQPDSSNTAADVWYPVKGENYNQLKVLYSNGKAVRAFWLSLSEGGKLLIFG